MLVLLEKVLGSGDAEPLTADSKRVAQVWIQAKRANAAAVEVGDENLATGKGYELSIPAAGAKLPEFHAKSVSLNNAIDLSQVYVLGAEGEGVNVIYELF